MPPGFDISLTLRQGLALHQAGQLARAAALYQQVLAAQPDNADALHLLGVALLQGGNHAQAEQLLRRAIAVAPRVHGFHNSLANLLRATGRPALAEQAYRAALRLAPNMAELHHNLGLVLADQGDDAAAERAFRQAIRLNKAFAPARLDLTNLLLRAHRPAEAEIILRPALLAAPNDPILRNTLGTTLAARGMHDAALAAYDAALAAQPGYANAWINRGAALAAQDKLPEAAASYQQATALAPNDAKALCELGDLRLRLRDGAAAQAAFQAAVALAPADAAAQHGLGRAFAMQDNTADALPPLLRATELDPANAEAWHEAAMAQRDLADWPASLPRFRQAAALAPDNAEIRSNFGYALLALGQYEEAWPHFLWRTRRPGNVRLAEPAWDGAPTDKTVLIHAEQGVGDTIQFVRFVTAASARARVVLAVPRQTARLLAGFPGTAAVVHDTPLPPYDLHIPLMSLPALLGVAEADFAATVPYLRADAALEAAWQTRLAGLTRPRVGLVWAGNPQYPADRRRSLPQAALAPLLALPGIAFISLQFGKAAPPGVFDAAPYLTDFAETAAALMALDLVITVDTAVAHLAGALGRPVWLMNRADTDWRWLLERCDSPWYPTMRIFRQPVPGDWESVIAEITGALRDRQTGAAPI